MKTLTGISGIILAITLLFSCKEDKTVYLADVYTTPASNVLYTFAETGGNAANDGGAQITEKGVCWGMNPDPVITESRTYDGAGEGEFSSFLDGLTPGTTYYVRAYATNSVGTVYGDNITFKTPVIAVNFNSSLTYGSVTDIQGKIYKTIPVAGQVWMAENLKTTQFNDGSNIPLIVGNKAWIDQIVPAYSWFNNNDSVYADIYGAYYNWYAVATGKLCPAGWHVPSDSEWQTLISYLGGDRNAGSKIKEAGKNNWIVENKTSTNQSGLTGLPAGLRETTDGAFSNPGIIGGWWSSTESSAGEFGAAWCRWVRGDTSLVVREEIFKKDGFSVRCVKNAK